MARALFKFFTDGNDTMKKFEPTIEQMGTEVCIGDMIWYFEVAMLNNMYICICY